MSDDIKLPELPDFNLKGVYIDGFSIKALEDYAREAVELNRAWLPIESAPKDGTTVLVFPPTWKSKAASTANFNKDEYAKRPRPYWKRDDDYGRSTISRGVPPTHWMPLPPPPEIE